MYQVQTWQIKRLFMISSRTYLRQILAQDPRPSYKDDAERIYGMSYGGLDIRFKGTKQKITVVDISEETR